MESLTPEEVQKKLHLDMVHPFSPEGIAKARRDIDFLFVDRYGNRVGEDYYDWVSDFEDGRAWVLKGDRFNLVDTEGKKLIRQQIITEYSPFSEGWARVRGKDEKYFFVDRDGKPMSDVRFDKADNFRNGMARVCEDGRWYPIDTTGKRIQRDWGDRPIGEW